jgi:RNA polymerase sigma-70 factor (ECF subfamily)
LGVASQRIALTRRRSEAAEKRALDSVALEARRPVADPELAFVEEHLREPFQRAIIDALKTLDDRQRMIYSLHAVDGLTIERIGAMYGVNHSTVSRWMASARAAVIAEAQRLLRDEMQLRADEFDSLARLLAGQLDLSVSLVLGSAA